MIATVRAGSMRGSVRLPSSKSVSQRALAAALVRNGRSIIRGIDWSGDEKAALAAIRQAGCSAVVEGDVVFIDSSGLRLSTHEINFGESGLSARLFIPLFAVSKNEFVATGEGSLMQRPFGVFERLLPLLGVEIQLSNGCLPAFVRGPMQPRDVSFDAGLSSQFLTGLLFAYACFNADATINVSKLNSKQYIDLTIQVLQSFHLPFPQTIGYKQFVFSAQDVGSYDVVDYTVEADWSSASCMLVAAALTGSVCVQGLSETSLQPDKAILKVFDQCGIPYRFTAAGLEVARTSHLQPFMFDATDCPDLFPALAVLASQCKGASLIKGVDRLTYKESDRAASIAALLNAFHITFKIDGNELFIEGGAEIMSAEVSACNDHRIAMCAAVFGALSRAGVVVHDAQAVSKSYPSFFHHFRQLGIPLTLSPK